MQCTCCESTGRCNILSLPSIPVGLPDVTADIPCRTVASNTAGKSLATFSFLVSCTVTTYMYLLSPFHCLWDIRQQQFFSIWSNLVQHVVPYPICLVLLSSLFRKNTYFLLFLVQQKNYTENHSET